MNYMDMPSKLTSRTGENAAPVKNDIAVNNSLNNIITTAKGSVPGHPEFGCGMSKYLFELIDPMIKESIKAEIEYAVQRWEPRVVIRNVEVKDDPDYNRLTVKLVYSIKNDIDSNQYEYIFSQQTSIDS